MGGELFDGNAIGGLLADARAKPHGVDKDLHLALAYAAHVGRFHSYPLGLDDLKLTGEGAYLLHLCLGVVFIGYIHHDYGQRCEDHQPVAGEKIDRDHLSVEEPAEPRHPWR